MTRKILLLNTNMPWNPEPILFRKLQINEFIEIYVVVTINLIPTDYLK